MFLAGAVAASLALLLVSGIAVLISSSAQSNKKTAELQTQLNLRSTATAEELNNLFLAIKHERAESVSDVSALQAEFNRKLAEKEETINQQASTVVAVQTQAANLQKEMQAQSANLQKDLDQKSEELEATQNKVRENTSAIGRINDSVFDATTLYQRAQQAVVLITTPGGQGSGFLIGEKKDRIVTAFHVAESMTSWDANITASNGIKTRARLEKKDEESEEERWKKLRLRGYHKHPCKSYGGSGLWKPMPALYPTGYVHEWRRVGWTSLKPRGKGDRRNKPSPEQHHRLCDSRRTNCSPRADTRSSLAVRTAISDTDRLRGRNSSHSR